LPSLAQIDTRSRNTITTKTRNGIDEIIDECPQLAKIRGSSDAPERFLARKPNLKIPVPATEFDPICSLVNNQETIIEAQMPRDTHSKQNFHPNHVKLERVSPKILPELSPWDLADIDSA
jgi:hypothetical protein